MREDTPLHTAAHLNKAREVQDLIASGANLNALDSMDLTPLMCACSGGKTMGSRIALLLIEAGADVNYVREDDDMTALMFAVHTGTPELIQTLIDRGALVEGPPGTDQTPLMIAARAGHVEGLKVLVRNGADIQRPCKLPWAGDRTAEGLAELEKRKKAVEYLRGVRLGTISPT
jgi:ankyrin repeat protein